jgi:hypothetical protein
LCRGFNYLTDVVVRQNGGKQKPWLAFVFCIHTVQSQGVEVWIQIQRRPEALSKGDAAEASVIASLYLGLSLQPTSHHPQKDREHIR